ncbi:MAG: aminodeoxychorismate/anthranilate synthase component II [Bacteroidales bacterium]|nr:aminodeoxychorismate/anthranilate synthase component II [Bacteroidales bacterium]
MKLLILDNYDSFTYNLYHYVKKFCDDVTVKRNDDISIDEVDKYDAIIISPGPGLPADAGITSQVLKKYSPTKKILGVCLGHQAIAECFDCKLINLEHPLHGVAVLTYQMEQKDILFQGLPNEFQTARYHSWIVDPNTIVESDLQAIAVDINGQIQALKHRKYNVRSVQFHPESILTDDGIKIIENWILKC